MPSSKPKPGKSLADVHPDLVVEWDAELNASLGRTPETTTPRSSFKAAWICSKCGHHWQATVNGRSCGRGCPKCAGKRRGKLRQRPPAGKSLGDIEPLVSSNWHPDRNGSTTPFDVFPRSEIDRWWKCPLGHEERMPPKRRVKGSFPGGCTICGGRRVLKGFNDLATTHPHVAKEWADELNHLSGFDPTAVSAGSEREFWWVCSAGHPVFAAVKQRVKSAGCPECRLLVVSAIEIVLRCEFKAVGVPVDMETRRWRIGGKRVQIDICAPDWKLAIEFDGRRWHSSNYDRDKRKTQFLEENGWTVVRIREALPPVSEHDVVIKEGANVPETVAEVLKKLRELNFSAPAFDRYINQKQLWAEAQSNRLTFFEREKSLANVHPLLANELLPEDNNGLRPEQLHPGSSRKVNWRCQDCGNVWKTSVQARVGTANKVGTGCPRCSAKARAQLRRAPAKGKSLLDAFPALAQEWDYGENEKSPDQYRPYSNDSVWWICPEKHRYQAIVASRTRNGTGCPVCDGKQVLLGYNDLASTNPELLPLWDYEKNTEMGLSPESVLAGSEVEAFWFCVDCGASRKSKIYSVMQGRHRCWDCGVQYRGVRKKVAPKEKSLAFLRPDLLEEWDYEVNNERSLEPAKVFARSHTVVGWLCRHCGHKWETKIQRRFNGGKCPNCRAPHVKKDE